MVFTDFTIRFGDPAPLGPPASPDAIFGVADGRGHCSPAVEIAAARARPGWWGWLDATESVKARRFIAAARYSTLGMPRVGGRVVAGDGAGPTADP